MNCSVVAMHFTTACNMQCSFCYRPREPAPDEKPFPFFIECVQHIKEIAPQIALGGGEPFLFPGFVADLGKECKKHGVLLNVTTNGSIIPTMYPGDLASMLENVTMVSVSYDGEKWNSVASCALAAMHVKRSVPSLLTGINFLLSPLMFIDKGKVLYRAIESFIKGGKVDRVFLLYPKNIPLGVDIREFKDLLSAISTVFPGKIFTDDLTRQVLDHGYPPWNAPCHFSRDMVSIDERGRVLGCSFDDEPLFVLKEPSDVLKVKAIEPGQRLSCPYLKPTTRDGNENV